MEVANLEESVTFYKSLGFEVDKRYERDDLFAKAALLVDRNDVRLELWQFNQSHPQHAFIKSHLALGTNDLENDLQKFVDSGCDIVIPVTVGKTLRYAFVKDLNNNYIELGQNLS